MKIGLARGVDLDLRHGRWRCRAASARHGLPAGSTWGPVSRAGRANSACPTIAIAALLAKLTARPVKLFLTREEVFLAAGNRPANTMQVRLGAKKDGTLTAIEFLSIGSGGAYPNGADTSFLATDLYTCPNVRTRDENVAINAGQARAMRAPGFPQGAWALEQAMDALALKLGMDPVELRLRNVPKVSQRRNNQPYTSTGLAECLRDGAKAFGWHEARKRAKGDGPIRRISGRARMSRLPTSAPTRA